MKPISILFFLFFQMTDMESYRKHVAKLLEICRDTSNFSSAAHVTLWKETFDGRRHEILSGDFSAPLAVIRERCPLLCQPSFVISFLISFIFSIIYINSILQLYDEFDLIRGENSCRNFRENWMRLVPLVVEVGREQKNVKNLQTVCKRYSLKKLEEDFGMLF